MTTKETDLTDGRASRDRVETEPEIVGGLSENVAGALAYLFAPFIGVLLYVLEGKNEFVRFHAIQSMIVFGGLFATVMTLLIFQTLLLQISYVGWIFALVVTLFSLLLAPVIFILWLLLTVKAYKGERYGLPIVGNIVEDYV